MPPRVSTRRCLAVLLLGGLSCLALQAQAPSRSPFLPPQTGNSPGPTQGAPLEFRGYVSTADGILYRVHDPAKKAGVWVKLNERNPDFDVVAKQYNTEGNTLTIEHGGRTLTLAVREAKVVSGGNAAQAAPPPPVTTAQPANVAPAVTQSVVLNPTPADEQRRLEAVAAEVARRRALREQATQQVTQSPQPQNAAQPANRAPAPLPTNQQRR